MKWIPKRETGDQTPIEATRFSHYVGTIQHWFCFHENLNGAAFGWVVSDWDSGLRVSNIEYITLAACQGNKKDAARMTLNKLIERVGESVVLQKLNAAPKREKVFSKAVASATL